MNETNLKKLWDGFQGVFDIGTYAEFKIKMATPTQRQNFYNAIRAEGYDLGPYDTYEARISGQLIPTNISYEQEFRDQKNTKWYVCKDGFPVDGIPYGCKSTTIRIMKHMLGLNDPNDGVYGNQFLKSLSDNSLITPDQAEQYMKDHSLKITKDLYDKLFHMKHPTNNEDVLKQVNESVKIATKKVLKSYFN